MIRYDEQIKIVIEEEEERDETERWRRWLLIETGGSLMLNLTSIYIQNSM